MTTDLPAPRPAALPEGGPRTFGPADESRLYLALLAHLLSHYALELMPVDPDAAPGALLTAALDLRKRTEHVVEAAVVAEHARGTTWEQIGGAAGTTKQTAHERWAKNVRAWAANGSTARPAGDVRRPLDMAAKLDADYARVHPERPDAVSSGLEAVRHPGSADAGAPQRQHATFLHTRIRTLRNQQNERYTVYQERMDTGAHGAHIAVVLREIAALQDRQAALFDELAEIEPELTDEHRAAAEHERAAAADTRSHADLVEKRPAPGTDTGETP